jgi:hypothetical protein
MVDYRSPKLAINRIFRESSHDSKQGPLGADLPHIRLHNVPLAADLLPRNFSVAAICLAHLFCGIGNDLPAFLPAKVQEASDDGDPVEIVRDDGAIGGAILPPEERVEDAPAAGAIFER